jgi:hypothetical protein
MLGQCFLDRAPEQSCPHLPHQLQSPGKDKHLVWDSQSVSTLGHMHAWVRHLHSSSTCQYHTLVVPCLEPVYWSQLPKEFVRSPKPHSVSDFSKPAKPSMGLRMEQESWEHFLAPLKLLSLPPHPVSCSSPTRPLSAVDGRLC